MKLLVFAHIPPPHHGQSVAVRQLLEAFGGDQRRRKPRSEPGKIACYHVDARVSDDITQVSAFAIGKVFRLFRYCAEAIWCRLRFGVDTFYYVPAPPKRVPFLRDCLVMALCRPFFRRTVLHWHAYGLSDWLKNEASGGERWLGQRLLGRPDLSLVLGETLSEDARFLESKKISVVPNGCPDSFPDFEQTLLPARIRRQAALKKTSLLPEEPLIYYVLFLGHCTRSKGLFDTLEAARLVGLQLEQAGLPMKVRLTVAGNFVNAGEEAEFLRFQQTHPHLVQYSGFVTGERKRKLFADSDCFCFPSYYHAEAQPLSIIEAMACGLAVVATGWRGIPEMLPESYFGLTIPHDPAKLADVLRQSIGADVAVELRERYLNFFTEESHVSAVAEALLSLDKD